MRRRIMKAKWMRLVGLGLLTIRAGAQDSTARATQKDKVSYGIGVGVARTLKSQGIDVNTDVLIKGLHDALAGQKLAMSDDELNNTMSALQQEVNQRHTQARAKEAEDNQKAGDAFLADNGKKDGVVTLPTGLQYTVLNPAQGINPTDANPATCTNPRTLF